MEYILKSYIKKLTNLSGNNKSLLFLKPSEYDLDLFNVDFFFLKPSFLIIEQLLKRRSSVPLSPLLDSRNSNINDISKKIRKIQRKERAVFEERGARDLYVAWPIVEGKFSNGTIVRSPLIFFPVNLELINNQWIISLSNASEIVFNKSFLTAYSHFNQVRVDDEALDTLFDESYPDSRTFRTALYEILKQNSIAINFNQDLFKDELQPLTPYTKSEAEEKFKNGELKLYSNAILGLFPPSGSSLIPDYEFLLNQDNINGLESFLSRNTEEDSVKKKLLKKEEMMYAPFAIDASQESAIHSIKTGNSLVIQGPPGTGKSQLICNVISDFIARGKVVLMVCQKRAALDVVYARLKEIGISDFLGLVHDFKNDRDEIFKKILFQIESIDKYREKNNTLRAIQLERNFLQVSRDMDQILNELEEFKQAFFDESLFGLSIKTLYLTSYDVAKNVDLAEEFKKLDVNSCKVFSRKIYFYYKYRDSLENLNFWKDRVSFHKFTQLDKSHISDIIKKIYETVSEKKAEIKKHTGKYISINEAIEIHFCQDQWRLFLSLIKDPLTFQYFKFHFIEKTLSALDLKSNINKLLEIKDKSKGYFLSSDLLELHDVVNSARDSSQVIAKRIAWRFFSKHSTILSQALRKNKLSFNFTDLHLLSDEIAGILSFEKILVQLKKDWDIPFDYSSTNQEIQEWLYLQNAAEEAWNIYNKNNFINNVFNKEEILNSSIDNLNDSFKSICSLASESLLWRVFLSEKQESFIINNAGNINEILWQLDSGFDMMVEADTLFEGFSKDEKNILSKLEQLNCDSSNAVETFEQNLRRYWINYLEEIHPVLRSVSTLRMEDMEERLQDMIKEKQRLSKEILQLRLTENTYKNIKYNRLLNPTTYRELKHQVSKKKRRWPVRKVIESHSDEIFNLLPVWLVSPESASAIFPMINIFDLVVFDESSQCFAEYSLPSIFRAKQIVITGDSQQLKPNDLYATRFELEDEESSDLEVDSLLDLGLKYLPQMYLQEHYRSRNISLINFSNYHFYNGNLNFLADRNKINNDETPIEFRKVDGIWEDNCNVIEAEEVVRLIEQLLTNKNKGSIGVVCFNYRQSQLIMDKLDALSALEKITIPENLFVKNIENVQGDERDTIIFSLGYAPDRKGKLSMHFGSLNQQGGSNRLNVAITRAREKIYIVSSLYPDQLKVEDSKNEGPKLLRLYLEYAYKISNKITIPAIQNEKFNSEWYLSYHLTDILDELSISFDPHFPDVDIAILKDNKYLSCIITDDEMYFQKPVKDFHAYKPMQLQKKNWIFRKVFSRQLYVNKQGLKDSFKNSVSGKTGSSIIK